MGKLNVSRLIKAALTCGAILLMSQFAMAGSTIYIAYPVAGSTVQSPFKVYAYGVGFTPTTVNVYLDGALASTSTFNANVYLSAANGSHRVTIQTSDSNGSLLYKDVSFYVSGSVTAAPTFTYSTNQQYTLSGTTGSAQLLFQSQPCCASVALASSNPSLINLPSSSAITASEMSSWVKYINYVASPAASASWVDLTATVGTESHATRTWVVPAAGDIATVTSTSYSSFKLDVSATSQSSTATLNLFVNGQFLGTLQNQGGGKYGGTFNINTRIWSNPSSINYRIVSSLGGCGTAYIKDGSVLSKTGGTCTY